MTITSRVICDSVSPEGIRLTTLQLRYPRFIHSEFMTHRVFSRNARSSRAVPVEKMIQDIIDDTAMPIHWGKNQKGMQAEEENEARVFLHGPKGMDWSSKAAWLEARDRAIEVARAFNEAGYHKQIVNRLIEPFMHIDVLVTATEWSNFFALRDHEAAMPEIRALAADMRQVMQINVPWPLQPGQWHLPYISDEEHEKCGADLELLLRLSVARCARISYAPFDGDASVEAELKRYDLLVGAHPMHASPAEHQATPDHLVKSNGHDRGLISDWMRPELQGNFIGWVQYRKTLAGECQ